MSSNFSLMNGQSIYVARKVESDGYWLDGVHYQGDSVTTYETLSNVFVEPMDMEEVEVSASGYSTKDVRWLLTDHTLNTYRENNDDASYADIVYLRDPEIGKKATGWVVLDNEDWDADDGFELLNSGNNYIIVREDKLK